MQTVEPSFRQDGKFGKDGHFSLSSRTTFLGQKRVMLMMMERQQQQGGVCPYSILPLRLPPSRRPALTINPPAEPWLARMYVSGLSWDIGVWNVDTDCIVVLLDSEPGRPKQAAYISTSAVRGIRARRIKAPSPVGSGSDFPL